MRLLVLLSALSLATTACGGSVMTAQRTASPVLLGPVDRVGGHRASPQRSGEATLKTSTEAGVYMHAYGTYFMASHFDSGSTPATLSLLDATSGKDDCDVHVSNLTAGGWVLNSFSTTWWQDESELRAWVRRSSR